VSERKVEVGTERKVAVEVEIRKRDSLAALLSTKSVCDGNSRTASFVDDDVTLCHASIYGEMER